MRRLALLLLLALVPGLAAAGCGGTSNAPPVVQGGDPGTGKRLIEHYGCGSCHRIPGVKGADGRVGPSLDGFRNVRYIAGRIANNPRNAIDWIVDPPRIEPGTIMPKLGVSDQEARDIVAYLYRQ
jgi:cytochrome c